jgi:hypothetical protein
MFYVGESKGSLKTRASQHINNIRNFIPYTKYENKEVAKHFRMKPHTLNDFRICVFRKDLDNDKK